MGGRVVRAGGAADEGRGEAPCQADEDEAQHVIEDGGWFVVHCRSCVLRPGWTDNTDSVCC